MILQARYIAATVTQSAAGCGQSTSLFENTMGAGSKGNPVSTLQVDEAFATGDDRFLDLVRSVYKASYLAGLAVRWTKDARPWAREQIFKYVALPFDRDSHHPLVKRLFKHAEANRDTELLAAFLVAFDRLIRREQRTRHRYDYRSGQTWEEDWLSSPRNQLMAPNRRRFARNPRTGEKIELPVRSDAMGKGILFSYKTRNYLRRRAWRYFRRLGFQRPAEYCQAVSYALVLYQDADFASGVNILDNRSLLQIAFRHSPVLMLSKFHARLADGRSLGELTAAPAFPKLWQQPQAAELLFQVLWQAQSRLVRVWCTQLLQRDHADFLANISTEQLLALLDHADAEVQQFGGSLLQGLAGADHWPVTTWLRLLETRNVNAIVAICQAMENRVRPERLSVAQCVSLACSRVTPVARLGLKWLTERSMAAADREQLVGLANAQCEAMGAEISAYALSILGGPQSYHMPDVCPFFDSLNPQVRQGAWDWLAPASPGYEDPALWSRLVESPFEDVRLRLISALKIRSQNATGPVALRRQDLTPIWTSVLFGIHRGGRAKLLALRQIAEALAADPTRAESLLPVFTVAIRSVRPAEARAGLSAILSAVAARPEIEGLLARQLPELRLLPIGAGP